MTRLYSKADSQRAGTAPPNPALAPSTASAADARHPARIRSSGTATPGLAQGLASAFATGARRPAPAPAAGSSTPGLHQGTRTGPAWYPRWFPLARLAWVAAAGAGWYVRPDLGPWLAAAAALPWLLHALRSGQLWHPTPFDAPLLLFLVTAAASLAAAYDPRGAHPVFPAPMGWGKFWGLALALLIFNATAALESDVQRRTLVRILACFGAAVAVYFMLTNDWNALPGSDTAVPPAFIPQLGRRIQAPFPTLPGHRLNRNVAGSLTALTLPMALALLAPAVGRRRARLSWTILGLALSAIIGLGVLLSHSRGAWLAASAVLALSAAWTLAGALLRPRWRVIGFLALVLIPTLAGVLAVATLPVLRARLLQSGAGLSNRPAIFYQGLLLVRDYPFTGFGLGQFPVVHSTYAELIHVPVLVFAHATPLDVALEQGLPAALALLGVWAGAAWIGWRALGSGRPRAGLAAGLLSLAVLAIHGTVDSTIYGSRALLLLWLPVGLIVAAARQPRSRRSPGTEPHVRQPGSNAPPDPLGPLSATGPGISAPMPKRPPTPGPGPSSREPRESPAPAPGPRPGSPCPLGPPASPPAPAAGDPAVAPQQARTPVPGPSAIDFRGSSAAAPPPATRRRWWARAAAAVAATLALVLGALFWRPLAAAWHANLGAVHQTRVELRAYDWHHFDNPTLAEVRAAEDLSAAIDHFQRALAFDPGQPTARTRLSQIAHARRAYDDALAHAQAAWDAGHRDRITRLVLGDALVAHGRVDDAVAVIQGLDRAAMRLSGQAFYHYQRHGDHERAAWAREAAEQVGR